MRHRPPPADPAWAYFLDVDGTLLHLAGAPDRVRVSRALRRVIEDLAHATGGAVALVSGRRIADLDRLFPGLRVAAAGQHGSERRSAAGRVTHASATPAFNAMRHRMAARTAGHAGLLLEDKGLSLALHFRGAPRLAATASRLARAEVARLGGTYRVQAGNRVVEIRPAAWDKGRAVRALMRSAPFRGRTPVFLGDDVTDEDAFAAVNRLGGHSVKVGRGRTRARWRLPDVAAARAWLDAAIPRSRDTAAGFRGDAVGRYQG